jgi:hypothetical protein
MIKILFYTIMICIMICTQIGTENILAEEFTSASSMDKQVSYYQDDERTVKKMMNEQELHAQEEQQRLLENAPRKFKTTSEFARPRPPEPARQPAKVNLQLIYYYRI